jgi:hypothetical protein
VCYSYWILQNQNTFLNHMYCNSGPSHDRHTWEVSAFAFYIISPENQNNGARGNRPLCGNGWQTTRNNWFPRQQMRLLEVVFAIRSAPRLYNEDQRAKSHSSVEGEWPVVVRPLLSSKRRPHLKTRRSFWRTKIWPWVPTMPETKNDRASDGQQQFTGLELSESLSWAVVAMS